LRNNGTYEPLLTSPIKRKMAPRHGERTRFGSNTFTGAQLWKLQETQIQRLNAFEEASLNVRPANEGNT
jgi:hypothetical protein